MKLLKIEENRGYFLDSKGEYILIDKIAKDDLLILVTLTLDEEEIEFDEYKDENLRNQAHQIIYKSIFEQLRELKDRRQEFIDQSERLYLQEYEKYREESSQN